MNSLELNWVNSNLLQSLLFPVPDNNVYPQMYRLRCWPSAPAWTRRASRRATTSTSSATSSPTRRPTTSRGGTTWVVKRRIEKQQKGNATRGVMIPLYIGSESESGLRIVKRLTILLPIRTQGRNHHTSTGRSSDTSTLLPNRSSQPRPARSLIHET